jgi:multimeric flavodoxin WrbA
MQLKVVGLSASLRNARRGGGNHQLIAELRGLRSKADLLNYLKQEAATHLANFQEAGRKEHLPFDVLYRNLKKLKGDRGLSNSEVALAAALWAAQELNCQIDHVALSEHFPENGHNHGIDQLKAALLGADGIILSTPVYFGDRGSLAQALIDLIRSDGELRTGLQGKVYAGIAVGAKRNGGQETTLIYQLLDMVGCGLLGVGNDSETTSQYGGTGWAGDVGTMPADAYGIDTSMGTGRRVARVAAMLRMAAEHSLQDRCKIAFWILQDKNDLAHRMLQEILACGAFDFDADIVKIADTHVVRCLACDVCPTHIDVDDAYRCIIKSKRDALPDLHTRLLEADAIVPVTYSGLDGSGTVSVYQQFIERTRYLRRGDYVFSDIICAPLVVEELGAGENMQIRSMTSMIRHHTIIMNPMTAYLQNGGILNASQVRAALRAVGVEARRTTIGRLLAYSARVEHLKYNPVGYVLSAVKDAEDEKLKRRREVMEDRVSRARQDAARRLVPCPAGGEAGPPQRLSA